MSSSVLLLPEGNTPARQAYQQENKVGNLTYKVVDGDAGRKLDAMFGVPNAFIELHPGRVLMPPHYLEVADRISNLRVRPDDVWVISYPRTGSTWAQEMVWLIGNDLDFEGAKVIQQVRTPLLELSAIMAHDHGDWMKEIGNSIDLVESKPSPRFIKSHLNFELLPTQIDTVRPKIVYIARDPKDTCVSFYHYLCLLHKMDSTFQNFAELMLQGSVVNGCIWYHMLSAWNRRNDPNFLFLKYEDMKKDQRGAIQRTAEFLGKSLSDEEVTKLIDYLSFNKMRSNPAVNLEPVMAKKNGPEFLNSTPLRFIRKGEVGDWRNHMSEELASRFDAKSTEMFRGTGLNYPS